MHRVFGWCHATHARHHPHRRGHFKRDGTRAETGFCLSVKRTSPFKWTGASVQLTTGSRGVCISGSNAGYTMFRGSVKGTGYPLHSPVSPSLPLPCVTVCHHISTGVYTQPTQRLSRPPRIKNSVQKTICCNSTSNAPDDGRMYPEHVELRIY